MKSRSNLIEIPSLLQRRPFTPITNYNTLAALTHVFIESLINFEIFIYKNIPENSIFSFTII
jgi:hypothetical protein